MAAQENPNFIQAKNGIKQPYSKFKAVSFDFWGAPVGQNPDGTLYCPGFYMQGDVYGKTANAYFKDNYSTVQIGLQGPLDKGRQPRTPGLVTVMVDKGPSLDMKKPSGSDGERATWHGLTCGRVQLQILIWTPEQLKQLRLLWSDLCPLPNKKDPESYSCQHPELALNHISALQFANIDGPTPGSATRSRVYTIHAYEFLPPSKKSRTKTDEAPLKTRLDPGATATPGQNHKNTDPT